MNTVTKTCHRCHTEKSVMEFYRRASDNSYTSECKLCMRERSKNSVPISAYQPRVLTERLAIERLHKEGIHAIPGKAIHAADVDVVCWGNVWLEVKHSTYNEGRNVFKFSASPKQQVKGYLADLVMLICEYPDRITYHLFEVSDPVFYIKGRIKSALLFSPGTLAGSRHSGNRVVMTQSRMDAAQDRWHLIEDCRISNPLRHTTSTTELNTPPAGGSEE